ncbi:MAG: YHS domain-containing protein [Pirellulales bacterium]
MSDLVAFAQSVKDQLNAAGREPHWLPEEAERYMAAVGDRRQRFEQLAARLIESVVQPRLETLAGHFTNASLPKDKPSGHCWCWFGYCERFPVSTKTAFAIEHDVRFGTVAVCYEAWMMPVFIKFNERDRLTVPLGEVNDDTVAEWVEDRLLEFLDAYLRIDRSRYDSDEEAATDPVCGMRISRSAAVASDSYLGHPYFFCSRQCQEKFAIEPTAYVQVKGM